MARVQKGQRHIHHHAGITKYLEHGVYDVRGAFVTGGFTWKSEIYEIYH